MISDEEREQVRAATDIVSLVGETVVLKQRGGEFWGCCPFHHEKSPSFHVNPSTGLWNCFGCHQGGDVFAYAMKRENLEFPDAIRYLADRAGIELHEEGASARRGPRRNRLIEANEEAQAFYNTMLMRGKGEGPESGRHYLSGRAFGSAVCKRWNLGFAPGRGTLVRHLSSKGFTRAEIVDSDLALERNGRLQDRFYDRVMFPIHDEQGRCIGFGGRVLSDAKPKYLNTRETAVFHKSKHMFAFDYAKESIAATGVAVVVEGYVDVITLHEAGYANVVATLGTALSEQHVKTLSRFAKTIICMFDGDAAGQKAADAAIQYLDKTQASLRCVVLPDNLDPDEFIKAKGKEALKPLLDSAEPLIDFVFDKRLGGYDLSVPGKRVAALDEMATLLAPLKHSPLMDEYATRLADALGMSLEETKRRIREKPIAQPRDSAPQEFPDVVPETYEPVIERPVDLSALSTDERQQVNVERELLSFMAASPDDIRPFSDRIASFSWTDSRHEAIAWAILATPAHTAPVDVVKAAVEVCPEATGILAGGMLVTSEDLTNDEKVGFLLDSVELYSTKRKIRDIKARLRRQDSDDAAQLFKEATELQKRANELKSSLSAMARV